MMQIPESAENYLETIYTLSMQGKPVRAVDIANALRYSKPSVSIALRNLRESGHVAVDGGRIALTKTGHTIAQSMHERHIVMSNWLISLGVPAATAHADACKIEHALSDQSFAAIKTFLQKTLDK